MSNIPLDTFISTNREDLILRCREKVRARASSPATDMEIDHGVPLFLDQLVEELRNGPSTIRAIKEGAGQHGRDLLRQGFTVSQVVHDYGDVCQSITDMAVEADAPIDTDDFRTLNRCLDDAIAGAVTEHARGHEVTRAGESQELRSLTNTAISAFEVIQTGTVGVAGTTGALVYNSLIGIRALMDRSFTERSVTRNLDQQAVGAGSDNDR
jgi:hypothetical protein